MDRGTRIQTLKAARFMQLHLPRWSDTVQESTRQKTKISLRLLVCSKGCQQLCPRSPAPALGCAARPSGPLSHTGSDACGEPAADWHTCPHQSGLRDIGRSASNMYIQLCPGCPSSFADVCLWLLQGVQHTGVSSPTPHQSLLKASAQTKAQRVASAGDLDINKSLMVFKN